MTGECQKDDRMMIEKFQNIEEKQCKNDSDGDNDDDDDGMAL